MIREIIQLAYKKEYRYGWQARQQAYNRMLSKLEITVNSEIFARTFIFAKLRSFMKIKPSRYGKITLSFIDKGKSCLNREFVTSLICILMLFTKIELSRKFLNLQ